MVEFVNFLSYMYTGTRTATLLLRRGDDGTGRSSVKEVVKGTCDNECQRRSMQACRHICSLLVLLYVYDHDGSKTAIPATWLPGARRAADISAGILVAPHIVYLSDCRVIPGATLKYKDFIDPDATPDSLAAKVQKALDDEKRRVERRQECHQKRADKLVLTSDSISTAVANLRTQFARDPDMLAFIESIPV